MTFQKPQLAQCPACRTHSLITIESRKTEHGTRRRKECEHCKHRITTHEVSADFYQEAKENLILVAQLHKLLGGQPFKTQQMENKCTTCIHNERGACAFDFPEYDTSESFDCNHYEH